MNDLEKALRDRGVTRWNDILAREDLLVPMLLLYQRTMRVALMLPTWEQWSQSEAWWEIDKQLDFTAKARFIAFWELLLECQREEFTSKGNDDPAGVILAMLFIAAEECRLSYSKQPAVDAARLGIMDEAFIEKVRSAVRTRIKNLLPGRMSTGASVEGVVAPKFSKETMDR